MLAGLGQKFREGRSAALLLVEQYQFQLRNGTHWLRQTVKHAQEYMIEGAYTAKNLKH